jgi:hypothetical protein
MHIALKLVSAICVWCEIASEAVLVVSFKVPAQRGIGTPGHTLIHDESRMPITFKCERVPCPDIESRSVCTAQAGLSPPSVPS